MSLGCIFFLVASNQLLVEPEGARLLTRRSTVLSGLELVDTPPKITPYESQSKRIETVSLKTKTVVCVIRTNEMYDQSGTEFHLDCVSS